MQYSFWARSAGKSQKACSQAVCWDEKSSVCSLYSGDPRASGWQSSMMVTEGAALEAGVSAFNLVQVLGYGTCCRSRCSSLPQLWGTVLCTSGSYISPSVRKLTKLTLGTSCLSAGSPCLQPVSHGSCFLQIAHACI